MKKLALVPLFLLACPGFGQEMSQVYVGMKDSLYNELLTRDIFSDVRLQTDYVVYTHLNNGTQFITKVANDGMIRYKGNSTRYYPKKGHQIKFGSDFPDPSMPGHFIRTLTLNPMYTDKSFIREAFVWRAYHDLGTMAPQTTYAQFYINTEYKGLYLQIDKVDKYLIKNWGRNNKCQMFEAEDYWCRGTLDVVADSLLRVYYLPELEATDLQYQRLKDMISGLNTATDEEFVSWFDHNFDTKSVMDWFAMNILATEGDTYNKNYFLYNDTTKSTQQWTIVPWDYDLSMGRKGDAAIPYPNSLLNDLFVYTYEPLAGPRNVLKDRFAANPELMERLRVYMDSLLTNVWTEAVLHARIDSLANIVRPYVGQESVPQTYGLTGGFEEQIAALKYYVTVRRNHIISTFTHPIRGDYHMATIRPGPLNTWVHAIAVDGRQVASFKLLSTSTPPDSIFFRVHTDSMPTYLADTTRGHIRRWLEVIPYPSTAVFTAEIQWSWDEYNQAESEVRCANERSLQLHYFADEYVEVRSVVNPFGNFVNAEIRSSMVGAGKHFAVLTPIPASADPNAEIPGQFALAQNYPNPFNPSTVIRYGLPHRAVVSLTVCNTLGQLVATLVQGEQDAGYHEVRWKASNLSSGVYLYRLQAGDFVQTRKLVLLR